MFGIHHISGRPSELVPWAASRIALI